MSNTSLNHDRDPVITEATNIGKAAPSFLYIFDSGVVPSGVSTPGGWRATTPEDLAANIGSIQITGVDTLILEVDELEALAQSGNQLLSSISGDIKKVADGGSFIPNFQVITAGQFQIPTGVRSYSIGIESGYAYINGVLMNAQFVVNGGGYEGRWTLAQQINVGTTGGRVLISYET